MPFTFHHVHIKARDPDKTAAWYERALGFTIAERGVRPGGDVYLTCRTPDGTTVAISGEKRGETLPGGTSATHLGLEHFAIATEDFDGDLERLKSHGAKVLAEPVTTPAGVRFAFVEAPDDVRIEVMYFPKA